MKYLTRYYKSLGYLDYDILHEFSVDKQARVYNEDFYLKLCNKRQNEIKENLSHRSESDLCDDLNKKADEINKAILLRYESDKRKIPKHWLGLYNVYWEDGLIVSAVISGKDLDMVVEDTGNMLSNIKFKNASVICHEGKFEAPLRIVYGEIIYEEPKMYLNILTSCSDITIEAEDIIIKTTSLI